MTRSNALNQSSSFQIYHSQGLSTWNLREVHQWSWKWGSMELVGVWPADLRATANRYEITNVNTWTQSLASIHPFSIKGVLHPWTLFLKTLCIFSKNKATSDKISYGSGQKCSKELKHHSFTSVETIVVKLQWKMCENQYFPCFEP